VKWRVMSGSLPRVRVRVSESANCVLTICSYSINTQCCVTSNCSQWLESTSWLPSHKSSLTELLRCRQENGIQSPINNLCHDNGQREWNFSLWTVALLPITETYQYLRESNMIILLNYIMDLNHYFLSLSQRLQDRSSPQIYFLASRVYTLR
jgi:hypothetical protein